MAFVYAVLEGVKYAFSTATASFTGAIVCLAICVWLGVKDGERKIKSADQD